MTDKKRTKQQAESIQSETLFRYKGISEFSRFFILSSQPSILFVYNADSGLFNLVADIGHKIFSPSTYSCDLCQLTHGVFKEREAWKSFIETLDLPIEFLHRDEFIKSGLFSDTLPAILYREGNELSTIFDREKLASFSDVDDLVTALRNELARRELL